MRNPFTLLTLSALALLAACGSDTTGPAISNNPGMSARIAGEQWQAMSIATDSLAPSLLVVTGSNAMASLTLLIPVSPGTGVQRVGSVTPIAAVLVKGTQAWAASRTQGGSGSLTLTTVAPGHVAGTFEFTLAHEGASPAEQQVTSGRFDVKY